LHFYGQDLRRSVRPNTRTCIHKHARTHTHIHTHTQAHSQSQVHIRSNASASLHIQTVKVSMHACTQGPETVRAILIRLIKQLMMYLLCPTMPIASLL